MYNQFCADRCFCTVDGIKTYSKYMYYLNRDGYNEKIFENYFNFDYSKSVINRFYVNTSTD